MINCERCGRQAKRFRAIPVTRKPGEPEQPTFELCCERCARQPKPDTSLSIARLERALRKVDR